MQSTFTLHVITRCEILHEYSAYKVYYTSFKVYTLYVAAVVVVGRVIICLK